MPGEVGQLVEFSAAETKPDLAVIDRLKKVHWDQDVTCERLVAEHHHAHDDMLVEINHHAMNPIDVDPVRCVHRRRDTDLNRRRCICEARTAWYLAAQY